MSLSVNYPKSQCDDELSIHVDLVIKSFIFILHQIWHNCDNIRLAENAKAELNGVDWRGLKVISWAHTRHWRQLATLLATSLKVLVYARNSQTQKRDR